MDVNVLNRTVSCTELMCCKACQHAELHRRRSAILREEYQQMAENCEVSQDFVVYAVDMQKNCFCPNWRLKNTFLSRLVIFNEKFASLNCNDDFTILRHKDIAKKQA